MSAVPDELTHTVLAAVESLTQARKAKLLLNHSLEMLEAGQSVLPHGFRSRWPLIEWVVDTVRKWTGISMSI